MYTIRVHDLENNTSYESNVKNLSDYHVKNPETVENVPEYDNKNLVDCIDLSFGVLLPINDGEDFYYQYINRPIVSFGEKNQNNMIGKVYGSIFGHLPDINPLQFLQRSWKENKRVDLRLEVFENNILRFRINIYIIKNGEHLYVISKDADEILELQQEEDKLLNSSHEGILLINKDKEILLSNNKIFEILGFSKEELVNAESLKDLVNSFKIINSPISTSEELIKNIRSIISHNLTSLTLDIMPESGENTYYQLTIIPIMYRNQEVLRISLDNITESKLQEIRALRLNNILDTMQDLASVALGYCELNNKKIQWTSEVYKILEISPDNVDVSDFHTCLNFFLPEDFHIHKEAFDSLSVDNPDVEFTIRVKTAKGNIKYIHQFYKSFYDERGQLNLFVIYSQDITKTQVELDQKDMLVKEVHHRVKNNLQIIISMLNLDLRFHPDDPMSVISDTRARLNYMSSLHEKIYKSSEFKEVDIKNYLPDIVTSLLRLYNSEISFNGDLSSEIVNLDIAIPIGLIVTEIVNNTIKYAFPEGDVGSFNIKFHVNDGCGVLECWDDGVGLPENFDKSNSDSLGMTVMTSLTSQINGNFKVFSDNGVHYQICFPL
jgi:PAS domain S-box-containing protein